LLERVLLAGLPGASRDVVGSIRTRAAVAADVPSMMRAMLPLSRVARYGDVRGSRADDLDPVIGGLFERIVVGLPGAVVSLDDAAARDRLRGVDAVTEAIALLDAAEMRDTWYGALGRLARDEEVPGLLRGRAVRLGLEAGRISDDELTVTARWALSRAVAPSVAAAWLEGLLRGSALVLLHQEALWSTLDGWLADLDDEVFAAMLPALRRGFSEFAPRDRQVMAHKVKTLGRAAPPAPIREEVDVARAAVVLPVLAEILGA
jgi:hypothetical protein